LALSNEPCRPENAGTSAGSPSPNLRRLLDRMWRLGFGTIRGLHVRAGDPLFDPPPLVVRTVRLAEAATRRRESASADCLLKREQTAFQEQLASIGSGVIDVIKIHDGLPVGLEIIEQL